MLCPRLNDSLIVDHQWVSKCWHQPGPKTLWLIIPFLAYCQPTLSFGSPSTIWCWYMLPRFPDRNLYIRVCYSWKNLAECVLPPRALFSLVSISKTQIHFIGPFFHHMDSEMYLSSFCTSPLLSFLFVLRGSCYVSQTNLYLRPSRFSLLRAGIEYVSPRSADWEF